MATEVTQGIIALREHLKKPITITENGDTFHFKKLTVSNEEALKEIIKAHQDPTLIPPKEPEEGADEATITEYYKELDAFGEKTERSFLKLTCELMRFVLVDSKGNDFFAEDDDILSVVNNVYARNFFGAYQKYRGGNFGGVAEAEKRFQK